jgi:hypothetical protein
MKQLPFITPMWRKLSIIIAFAVLTLPGCKKSSTSGSNPSPKTYTITAYTTGQGSITPSGANNVYAGANVDYIMTPAANYAVSSLAIDNKAVNPATTYQFTNIQANHTISVAFAPTEQISVTTDGNGTVTLSPSIVTVGQSVTFTFAPNAGFTTDSLYIDGKFAAALSGKTTYTLANVTQAHTISITFILTAHTLDSLNNLLIGKWTMTSLNSTLVGAHGNFLGWDIQDIYSSCSSSVYSQYFATGVYVPNANLNGTNCSPLANQQFQISVPNHWKLKNNGKVIYMTDPPLDSLTNVTITKDSLIAIYYGSINNVPRIAYWYHYARTP